MIASYPDRRFQLWEYRVSHGSLLFRSPRIEALPVNVDVAFVGVEYLAVPRILNGLTLEIGREDDRLALVGTLGDLDLERVFVLVSVGHRYPVVAAACRVSENDADIFESPF